MDAKKLREGDFFDVTGTVFKSLNECWEAFKLNWQLFVIALVIMMGAGFVAAMFAIIGFGASVIGMGSGNDTAAAGSVLAFLGIFLVMYLLVLVVIFLIAPTVITGQLASVRNKQISFGDAFKQSKSKILGFIGLSILMSITIGVGFLLLIVPGLLAIFFLTYAPYIYMDRKIGVTDSMKASYELAKEYWKVTLGMLIVYAAISILGNITFIGQLASLVLTVAYFCLGALVYVTIAGKAATVKEAEVVAPKKAASPKAK